MTVVTYCEVRLKEDRLRGEVERIGCLLRF